MVDWTLKDLLSIVGPTVSLGGAAVSWYWAQKRLRWDAGKELGVLRADTIALIEAAKSYGGAPWRYQLGAVQYLDALESWRRILEERAPLIGKRAYEELRKLEYLLVEAHTEAYGYHRIQSSSEEDWGDPKMIDYETVQKLESFIDRLRSDREFLSK